MTKTEIASYLSYEEFAKSKDSKITRVILKNGETHPVHFLSENQKDEYASQNKWVMLPLNDFTGYVIMDGENILELKVGAKPFN